MIYENIHYRQRQEIQRLDIKNKSGLFSNVARNNDITWVDNIYKASFFNYNNASLIANSQGLKDITIVKIS